MFSFKHKKTEAHKNRSTHTEREIIIPEFQTIINSAKLKGSLLIYDLKEDSYYSNNFQWAKKGYLPASFNI